MIVTAKASGEATGQSRDTPKVVIAAARRLPKLRDKAGLPGQMGFAPQMPTAS
ncbi:MAG: hypothetical protein LBT52_04500 [Clostridiales Family XIII bacterium]|nr:hypothetical protein [Clostridiales Family XIII bacterium]